MLRPVLMIGIATVFASVVGMGCASGGSSAPAEAAQEIAIPADSAFAKLELKMSDEQVRSILGSPDDSNSYPTGKAWIPYYYGPDTSRSDWLYRGQGRIVFSRNRYSGGLKVIRVMYNPADNEL